MKDINHKLKHKAMKGKAKFSVSNFLSPLILAGLIILPQTSSAVDVCDESIFGTNQPFTIPLFNDPALDRVADPTNGRSVTYGKNIVASSNQYATMAAIEILRKGGNAIDAAVALGSAYGVVEPHHGGIGGDAFFIIWSAKHKKLFAIRGQGKSPELLTRQKLVDMGLTRMPLLGPVPIMVPGAVGAWQLALDEFGTMSLSEVLQPSVDLASQGFFVSEITAHDWNYVFNPLYPVSHTGPNGSNDPGLIQTYGSPVPKAGDFFRNPDLANSLRILQKRGPKALYGGVLGKKIDKYLRDNYPNDSFLRLKDLKNYEPEFVELLSVDYLGHRVYEMPAPSQGIVALQALKLLEPFVDDPGEVERNSADYIHLVLEALKIGFADYAAYIGDPDTMAQLGIDQNALLSDSYIDQRRLNIDINQAKIYPPGTPGGFTSYATIADSEGNMVSYIQSPFWFFGGGIVPKGLGFPLSDRGTGFSFDPNVPNVVGPNKLSQMSNIPAFLTKVDAYGNERPIMSFGVMGASMQPQGHVQFLNNLLVFGLNIQQAMDAERVYTGSGLEITVEPYITQCVINDLESRGHVHVDMEDHIFGPSVVLFGKGQAIRRIPHGYEAASDRRSDGVAVPLLPSFKHDDDLDSDTSD